ncbi:MAG: large conductance mechanosensitive channel protein MscL [Gemmatimonadota bacterium]|nr:large conductance mechanosensitive channel protein MscL [Gemmatimonadota bacterium]
MLKEFRDFAVKGNMLDMAVGIIIGAAFGTIVTALVNEVLMPVVGLFTGGVDFSEMHIVLQAGSPAGPYATVADAAAAGAVTLNWGIFVNALISFLIVAFVLFMVIRNFNRLKKQEEEAPPAPAEPSAEETLLTEIRDLLKKQNA